MKTGYLNPKYSQGTYNKSTLQESIKQILELPLPDKITTKTTEEYYLALSQICRLFIKKEFENPYNYAGITEMNVRIRVFLKATFPFLVAKIV